MEFNVSFSMQDILKILQNNKKTVQITLKSGKTLSGLVKSTGIHFMVLSLAGDRSFYDSFIRIDSISAIEAQIRS